MLLFCKNQRTGKCQNMQVEKKLYLKNYGDNYKIYIQGVLKIVHNIHVTRIYVEYQIKNSNSNLVS
jgi:hypothetical protein